MIRRGNSFVLAWLLLILPFYALWGMDHVSANMAPHQVSMVGNGLRLSAQQVEQDSTYYGPHHFILEQNSTLYADSCVEYAFVTSGNPGKVDVYAVAIRGPPFKK